MKLRAALVRFAILMLFAAPALAQQAYPNRPIRFIIPFPPGGAATPVARLVGERITENWNQPIIVDNRPGGNTIIGTDLTAKAAPDGYTMLLTASASVIVPLLQRTLPYDFSRDLAPVASIGGTEQVMVLNNSVPANTLQEFIAYAKTKPGQLNYASAGTGTTNHMASEFFNLLTDTKIQEVPFQGGGADLAGVIGGHVQMLINNPLTLAPQIKAGKVKALAISGDKRSPSLPQVPTFTEAGLPGFDVKYWLAVFAPAKTPKDIVDKMSGEIARILALPDVREKLTNQGFDPFISNPEQLATLVKADSAKYAKIIKAANIKVEN